jgi:tetratricopeptide (TPR) repeat protein
MRRSSGVAAGVVGLAVASLAAALHAEEPAKAPPPAKPPWQRLLRGDDARKAAEQEKRLTEWQEAVRFAEALQAAQAMAELRGRVQGADHWQAVDARWEVEALGRVVGQGEETRKAYAGSFVLARQAAALEGKGRYQDAQPLQEKLLAIYRKVLGEEHPHTATCYGNLAANQNAQGRYKEAEEGYGKALAICRKVLGEEHPHTALKGGLQMVDFKR